MRYEIQETRLQRWLRFYSEDGEFPLEISVLHIYNPAQISYEFKYPQGGVFCGSSPRVEIDTNTGKLTGIQLRAIAAKDQLDTLLEDELFDAIKVLAEADVPHFGDLIQIAAMGNEAVEAALEEPKQDVICKAIKAMALFCYTEIVERGLKKPGTSE